MLPMKGRPHGPGGRLFLLVSALDPPRRRLCDGARISREMRGRIRKRREIVLSSMDAGCLAREV